MHISMAVSALVMTSCSLVGSTSLQVTGIYQQDYIVIQYRRQESKQHQSLKQCSIKKLES
jgi:hypothetical protein